MTKFTLRTSEVRSSLLTVQRRVSDVQDQINSETASQTIIGQREAIAALVDLGSLVSNFAKHISMCTDAWDQFAIEADAKLQQLDTKLTGSR